MILRRPYVPSAALIRALARPQPPRCPFARPLPAQFVRGKKTKSQKAREAEKARLEWEARKERRAKEAEEQEDKTEEAMDDEILERMKKDKLHGATAREVHKVIKELRDPDKIDKYFERPIFEDGEDVGVDFYEEDPVTGDRVKVDKLGTKADQIKEVETLNMIKNYMNDPDYDAAALNKRMMDNLIADPAFADLTEDLKEIKEEILTKEEERQVEEDARKDAEPEIKQFGETMRSAIHEAVTQLYNDPDVGNAKADLQAVLEKLQQVEDVDDPELQVLLDRATDKVNQNPKLQAKLSAGSENETEEDKQQWANFEKEVEELLEPEDEEDFPDLEDPEEMNKLLVEMRELMQELNDSGELSKELDNMLSDENGAKLPSEKEAEQLASSIARFAERRSAADTNSAASTTEATTTETPNAEEDEHIPPELQAKVDKIMADPRLLEKLSYIQQLIADHSPPRDPNDLTQIDAELAPDPYEMEDSRTATLAQRMAAARADPEHSAALHSLKVKLQPPYNISPALKSFNQALSFAYVGANDDVRRVLWRSYQKARTLPTFLQNMSDDAWDLLYYSQAVTWTGNQNRTDHLKMLLGDLKTVGKDGPPTHPSSLGQHQEAARLEAAQREQREAEWREGGLVTKEIKA